MPIPTPPIYCGGMILSGTLEDAYRYEYWLKDIVERRYNKYKKNWGFLVAMKRVTTDRVRRKLLAPSDFYPIGDDPLVHINADSVNFKCLRLPGSKLNIVKLEVMKYVRRTGRLPL